MSGKKGGVSEPPCGKPAESAESAVPTVPTESAAPRPPLPQRPSPRPSPSPRPRPQTAARRQRDEAIRSLDQRIGEALAASQAELQASPAWGKPLPDDGYLDTPPELRLAFKLLKNAGHVPAEVELMRELQRWRDQHAALPPGQQAAALAARIAERRLLIALRIERLAKTKSL